jgi:hypothetical protein
MDLERQLFKPADRIAINTAINHSDLPRGPILVADRWP